MPAIAQTATKNQAAFFWHLGDLRVTSGIDDDMAHQPEHVGRPMMGAEYLRKEWPDFIESQVKPFGTLPFIIGIGNHDVAAPKNRDEFVAEFAKWLDQPMLHGQRLTDDPTDGHLRTYFHWIVRGVAFYFLDNASNDRFDLPQIAWFERLLARDEADASVKAIVVGMHKPLPDSFAGSHSMNESSTGIESGRLVMADLQRAQDAGRQRIYALASHQHFLMENYLSNDYWRAHGGVVPGWVIGTAGAPRYPLPTPLPPVAKTNVYGSLLATVLANGEIRFEFQEVKESDIPASVVSRYGQPFVHWCIVENTRAR